MSCCVLNSSSSSSSSPLPIHCRLINGVCSIVCDAPLCVENNCIIRCPKCETECVCVRNDGEAAPASVTPPHGNPRSLFRTITESHDLLQRISDECASYTMANGITMMKHSSCPITGKASSQIMHAPVTLLPHIFSSSIFTKLQSLAHDFNIVYERVSRDTQFLFDTLSESAKLDPFLARLLGMLKQIEALGPTRQQSVHLAINRSDYLLQSQKEDSESDSSSSSSASSARPLQVEYNTISAGAGSLSNKASEMHRFILERYVMMDDESGSLAVDTSVPTSASSSSSSAKLHLNLPVNTVIDNLTASMAQAHGIFIHQYRAHLKQQAAKAPAAATKINPVVLFVVQPKESNLSDQRALEYALWKNHKIPVLRMTLTEIASAATRDAAGYLWLTSPVTTSPQLISLAYFRAGYTPRDYPSEAEWVALFHIESSLAIKCPRLAYHLAGTKKIQQVLAQPGVLERFTDSTEQAERLRSVFAGQYSPCDKSLALLRSRPNDFVLKPQREGGGNNLWGEEMLKEIAEKTPQQLQQYIIMEKIKLAEGDSMNECSRPALKFGSTVNVPNPLSELGMMGAVISEVKSSAASSSSSSSSSSLVFHRNEYLGYLLRTKDASLNEGGLMSGAGAIDSIVLV